MRRALAVLAAGAMVVAALVIRDRRDDDRGPTSRVLRVTCATELAPVCARLRSSGARRMAVTSEPAGATADRLARVRSAEEANIDGWLVAGPWPELVRQARQRAGLGPLLDPLSQPIARSRVALAVWESRAAVLRARCAGTLGWRCLGEQAPRRWSELGGSELWGPVKVAFPDPTREAVGLALLGAATSAYLGRSDFSTADLDDSYRSWLSGFGRAVRRAGTAGSPLERMLAVGEAVLDAVGALEAHAVPLVRRSARGTQVELIYPSPMTTADAVLGTVSGADGSPELARLVRGREGDRALAAEGWRVPGEPLARRLPAVALPPTSGLPSPGVLGALRLEWAEAVR